MIARQVVPLHRDEFRVWAVFLLRHDRVPGDRELIHELRVLREPLFGYVDAERVRRLLRQEKRLSDGVVGGPVDSPSRVCFLRRENVSSFLEAAAERVLWCEVNKRPVEEFGEQVMRTVLGGR